MTIRILFGICAWIPFLIVASLCSIPFVILWCYRFCVAVILKRVFRIDLIEPMILPETGFATDNIWTRPKNTVAFVHVMDKPLDLESLRIRLCEVIQAEVIRNGKILPNYDRLTSSYPTTWLGYSFWTKLTKPFDIYNHLKIYCSKRMDDRVVNIEEIVQNWFESTFQMNCPLWDIIVISDVRDIDGRRKSIFGFRIHHLIGDGYSILGFLEKVFDQDPSRTPPVVLNHKPMTIQRKLKMWFYMPLTQGTKLAELFLHSDYFSTVKSGSTTSYSKIAVDLTEVLLVRKKLSGAIGGLSVPFATVILFIFGTALKKAFISNFVNTPEKSACCLQSLKVGMSMPKSTPHPRDTFCNHWSYGAFDVPLMEESPLARLKKMVSNISQMKSSAAFEMNAISDALLYSQIPQFAFNLLAKHIRGTTIGMTNLPGPSSSVRICNSQVLEKYLMVGLQTNNTSFMIGCFSYNNQLTISIIGNEQVINKRMSQQILNYFKDEVKNLLVNGIITDEEINPEMC